MVDATSATVASIFGSSPATVFVESGVGVAQGGRTGLTAIIAGLLFLPFLFLSPLINSISYGYYCSIINTYRYINDATNYRC